MIELVTDYLSSHGIPFTLYRHEAVVSVEDSKRIIHLPQTHGYKSLFVKDKKSDRYFLAVLPSDKRADMRRLAHYVGAEKFEFADADTLMRYLKVCRGSVSPFCLLNPDSAAVGLLLDKDLQAADLVRFHPCDNTATVVLTSADFLRYLAEIRKPYIWVD